MSLERGREKSGRALPSRVFRGARGVVGKSLLEAAIARLNDPMLAAALEPSVKRVKAEPANGHALNKGRSKN